MPPQIAVPRQVRRLTYKGVSNSRLTLSRLEPKLPHNRPSASKGSDPNPGGPVPKTTSNARQLVSLKQAAAYVDVNPITLRRWISAGRVRAYRVGPRFVKVDLNELETLLRPVPTADGSDV